jgi:hypothetical protein
MPNLFAQIRGRWLRGTPTQQALNEELSPIEQALTYYRSQVDRWRATPQPDAKPFVERYQKQQEQVRAALRVQDDQPRVPQSVLLSLPVHFVAGKDQPNSSSETAGDNPADTGPADSSDLDTVERAHDQFTLTQDPKTGQLLLTKPGNDEPIPLEFAGVEYVSTDDRSQSPAFRIDPTARTVAFVTPRSDNTLALPEPAPSPLYQWYQCQLREAAVLDEGRRNVEG